MRRMIVNDRARRILWELWQGLLAVKNGRPYTFEPYAHGDALRESAKTIDAILGRAGVFDALDYDDQTHHFERARAHDDVRREDDEAYKRDNRYTPPRNLVLCGGGGRHLATELLDAGLVQDVYLTTAPNTGGQPGTPMYPRRLSAHTLVRKHGTGAEAGVLFEHLRWEPR